MTFHAGFDTYGCPDAALAARLKRETNFEWMGYYLASPSQPAKTWQGQRARLVAQGWGLLPIYVGQQLKPPGALTVTALQGKSDGAHACRVMAAEGFPAGSGVWLDLENGLPFPQNQKDYVREWCAAVDAGGYRPGVYCSYTFADQVHAVWPEADIWVFHVRSVNRHSVTGHRFPIQDPATSGYAGAMAWQHEDSCVLTDFSGLFVDLDVSLYADPSAPRTAAASTPRPTPPAPAGGLPPAGDRRAQVVWVQALLNSQGASISVDGDLGPKTLDALVRFLAGVT